jgi:hypothetical protein
VRLVGELPSVDGVVERVGVERRGRQSSLRSDSARDSDVMEIAGRSVTTSRGGDVD